MFQQAFIGRIAFLGKTHSVLTEVRWQAAPLHELVCLELEPYDDAAGKRIQIREPQAGLPRDLAVPIGMAIHEMTANAVNYDALSELGGMVTVVRSLLTEDGQRKLQFEWIERNGKPVDPPTRQGFGSRLLERVLTSQIHADVTTYTGPRDCASWVRFRWSREAGQRSRLVNEGPGLDGAGMSPWPGSSPEHR